MGNVPRLFEALDIPSVVGGAVQMKYVLCSPSVQRGTMPRKLTRKAWDLSVAEALSDALVGYLTLQARARMYQVYSEYLLYDTVARIAHGRHWHLECEVPLSKGRKAGPGDYQRIDFLIRKTSRAKSGVLIELKYCRSPTTIAVGKDIQKLQDELAKRSQASSALLLVVGARARTKSVVGPFRLSGHDASSPLAQLYDIVFRGSHTCFGATAWRVRQSAGGA